MTEKPEVATPVVMGDLRRMVRRIDFCIQHSEAGVGAEFIRELNGFLHKIGEAVVDLYGLSYTPNAAVVALPDNVVLCDKALVAYEALQRRWRVEQAKIKQETPKHYTEG